MMAERVVEKRSFNKDSMQHIVRILGTNIDGKKKIGFSLTKIRGIGRQMGMAIITQAKVDKNKFAGELNQEEIDRILEVIRDPLGNGIPSFYLNSRRNFTTGEDTHSFANVLDENLRKSIENGKKFGEVRKCRLAIGLKCNGQHTCSNGRRQKMFSGKKK